MGVKLYTLDASPPARAAMMALEIFNVPFEKIDVNLGEGQHLTPEYLKYSLIMEGKKTKEQKHLDLIEEVYGFMEVFLSRTTYIAADHVTIADVSALSSMSSMVNLQKFDENKQVNLLITVLPNMNKALYPKTAAWYKKMKSTPYCKKYNDHGEKALLELVTKLLNS